MHMKVNKRKYCYICSIAVIQMRKMEPNASLNVNEQELNLIDVNDLVGNLA